MKHTTTEAAANGPRFIKENGETFVVIRAADFKRLCERAEMAADVKAFKAAKKRKEESFPVKVVNDIIDGLSPVAVLRKYRGMTQRELADAAGLSQNYISAIESGTRQGSDMKVVKALAVALKVPVDMLMA